MIECEFLQGDVCLVATKLCSKYGIDSRVKTKEDVCRACLSCECPKSTNYAICSLVFHTLQNRNIRSFKFDLECVQALTGKEKCVKDSALEGPGTELHKICLSNGYDIQIGCRCIEYIRKMNLNGPEWSLSHIEEIIESIVSEAKRRGIKIIGINIPEILLRYKARQWIQEACQKSNQSN